LLISVDLDVGVVKRCGIPDRRRLAALVSLDPRFTPHAVRRQKWDRRAIKPR